MWRSAGLHISQSGYILPSNDPKHHEPMQDDMISNALIWLMMKLINFIAAGDDVDESLSPLGFGIRQNQLLEYWEGLDRQLNVWHDGLPDSFKSTATTWPDNDTVSGLLHDIARHIQAKSIQRAPNPTSDIPKKWFARPMCASTMQSFHFARIQLLHNKPHVSTGTPRQQRGPSSSSRRPSTPHAPPMSPGSSLAQRHASYAAILQHSRHHAREIVAIAQAQTDEGVRIHSVQPLYTAGQVLGIANANAEGGEVVERMRTVVVGLLRGIESDTGWATEYRVAQLLEEWGVGEA